MKSDRRLSVQSVGMSSMVDLVVGCCESEAAAWAIRHWHYSRSVPSSQFNVGAWENGQFVGAVVFGIGAGNSTSGLKYGLKRRGEVAELVRVALGGHESPTTQIVSKALKLMRAHNPGIRLVVSFADYMAQGHLGIIYQAGNWVYAGAFVGDGGFKIHGKVVHTRTIGSRGWGTSLEWLREHIDPNCEKAKTVKHRYLMPADKATRKKIEPLREEAPRPAGDDGGHA